MQFKLSSQIQLEIYSNPDIVTLAEFDGTESNNTTWFSLGRLQSSSWEVEIVAYKTRFPMKVILEGTKDTSQWFNQLSCESVMKAFIENRFCNLQSLLPISTFGDAHC